jgi:hypothetical protein
MTLAVVRVKEACRPLFVTGNRSVPIENTSG